MITLKNFRPEVAVHVPSCPGAMIDRAVRHAASEFCEYTLTWREEADRQRVRAKVGTYDITIPSCALLVTVIYAEHDEVRLIPTSERTLDDTSDGWRLTTNAASNATYYYLPDKETIRISLPPSASASRALVLACAFKPTQDGEELPDALYNHHLEAIGFGALSRLMAIPNQPWSDPGSVKYYLDRFDAAKRKEKAERLNDYTRRSTLSVVPVNYYG